MSTVGRNVQLPSPGPHTATVLPLCSGADPPALPAPQPASGAPVGALDGRVCLLVVVQQQHAALGVGAEQARTLADGRLRLHLRQGGAARHGARGRAAKMAYSLRCMSVLERPRSHASPADIPRNAQAAGVSTQYPLSTFDIRLCRPAPPTLPSVAASSGVSTSPHSAALMGALQSGSGQGTWAEHGGSEGRLAGGVVGGQRNGCQQPACSHGAAHINTAGTVAGSIAPHAQHASPGMSGPESCPQCTRAGRAGRTSACMQLRKWELGWDG